MNLIKQNYKLNVVITQQSPREIVEKGLMTNNISINIFKE